MCHVSLFVSFVVVVVVVVVVASQREHWRTPRLHEMENGNADAGRPLTGRTEFFFYRVSVRRPPPAIPRPSWAGVPSFSDFYRVLPGFCSIENQMKPSPARWDGRPLNKKKDNSVSKMKRKNRVGQSKNSVRTFQYGATWNVFVFLFGEGVRDRGSTGGGYRHPRRTRLNPRPTTSVETFHSFRNEHSTTRIP